MSKPFLITDPNKVELSPEAIPENWILSGTPEAMITRLVRTHDWNATVVIWECTAGKFKWHYGTDESVIVLSGEAFMVDEAGGEQRFGAGDVGYFPAGFSCTWRVPQGFKKVAVVRETMWRPVGFCFKVVKKLSRTMGLGGKSAI